MPTRRRAANRHPPLGGVESSGRVGEALPSGFIDPGTRRRDSLFELYHPTKPKLWRAPRRPVIATRCLQAAPESGAGVPANPGYHYMTAS